MLKIEMPTEKTESASVTQDELVTKCYALLQ